MVTAAKERVIETASTKPMSRRALAIAAGVGYATITKMIEAGELAFDGDKVSVKKGKKSSFSLEVFESDRRGGRSEIYTQKPVVSIRSEYCSVFSAAAKRMGLSGGHMVALSVNPADRSAYIGVVGEGAKVKGYYGSKLKNSVRFPMGKAKGRIPEGIYEVDGEGHKHLGATWFKLNKVSER